MNRWEISPTTMADQLLLLLLLVILFPCFKGLKKADSICYGNNLDSKGEANVEEVVSQSDKPLDLECPTNISSSSRYTYSWFFWKNKNRWTEYPWYKAAFYSIFFKTGTNNGTLRLLNPLITHDSGYYACCSYNEDNSVSDEHKFNVELIDCSDRAGPVLLEVPTDRNVSVEIGGNVTLPACNAYFGCLANGTEAERNVYWTYNGAKVENGERFQITYYKSRQSVIVGSSLTIKSIQESDLKYLYYCVAEKSPGLFQTSWSLQLKEKVGEQTVLAGFWFGVIAVVVALILIFIIVFTLWGPRIHLCFKIMFCHFSSESKENKTVGILHDMEDTIGSTFINKQLKPQLTKYGFTCSIIQHVPFGETKIQTGHVKLSECDAVISVMTWSTATDLSGDGVFHFLMNSTLVDKVIVFGILLHEDLTKEELKKTVKAVSQKYVGVTVLKWVTQPSKRLVKNFWCEVRLKLLDVGKKPNKGTSRVNNLNYSETLL